MTPAATSHAAYFMAFESFKDLRKTYLRRLNRWWAKTPRWQCRLIIFSIVAGCSWILAKPAYSHLRRWLIERNYNAAIEASDNHQPAAARDLALAVAFTGDTRIEMLRVLERSAHELGDPRYERYGGALLAHPQSTAADRLRVFQSMALNSPFGRLQSQWAGLAESDRTRLPFRLALTDRVIRDGAFKQALSLLDDLPIDSPAPEVAARRIRCLIGQSTEQSLELAQQRIVANWQQQPEHPADWCALLESLPVGALDVFILNPLRPWLARGRPGKPGQGELLESRIRWQASNPADRDAVVSAAIARWRTAAPVPLSAFLTAVAQPERLVDTFSDEAVSGNPDLIKARLKALIQLNRNTELTTTLGLHGATLPPIDQMSFATVAAHRINDGANQNLCWNKALAEGVTSQRPDDLLNLYGFANRAGLFPEAERALVAAIKAARGPLPPYESLAPALENLTHSGLEHDLMAILNEYLKFEPWNPLVISRHGYLAALLGLEKPTNVINRITDLADRFPTETQVIAVLASLQVLAELPDQATATWQRLTVAPEDLTLGYRAAHLMTSVLTGRLTRDAPVVKELPVAELLPSERSIFQKLIRPDEPAPPTPSPAADDATPPAAE